MEAGTVRRRVASDATGRFTFEDCSAPRIVIRVRRLGYQPRMLEVAPVGSEATLVEIVLADVPAELAEIVVRPRPSERLREFYERKGQGRGFARFLEYAEIDRLAPRTSSDLFRNVPGITIRAASWGGNTIRIRGCQPMVWVDGQRVPSAELDEVVRP